jgi:hypothetical protein
VGWPTRVGGPNRRIRELPLSVATTDTAGQIWRAGVARQRGSQSGSTKMMRETQFGVARRKCSPAGFSRRGTVTVARCGGWGG